MEKRIEEGPPLYMESLLDSDAYSAMSRLYRNTYKNTSPRHLFDFKEGEFKCRYRMGFPLLPEEIISINNNLDYIKQHAGIK